MFIKMGIEKNRRLVQRRLLQNTGDRGLIWSTQGSICSVFPTVLKKSIESTRRAYCTESKAFFTCFKKAKIRSIFSTLDPSRYDSTAVFRIIWR